MKKQEGISLVALIITIIVMVILAGVIIVSAVADGGIIDRAQDAMKENEMAEIKEIAEVSRVFEKNASVISTYAYLNLEETSKTVYENLTLNKFVLKDSSGKTLENEEEFLMYQKNGGTIIDEINLNVQGKHGEYEGTIEKNGNVGISENTSGSGNITGNTTGDTTGDTTDLEETVSHVYSFTLKELGDWKIGTEGWISFNLATLWKKIGKNLYKEDTNYVMSTGQDGNEVFALGSKNKKIANGVKLLLGDEEELKKEISIVGHILEDYEGEFLVQVSKATQNMEEILSDEESYNEFMETYGNTIFYFMSKEEVNWPY